MQATDYRRIRVHPVAGSLGAEIAGADLANLDAATFAEIHAAFGEGKAAMNIEGSWFVSDIGDFFGDTANNKNDWDWVPMPSAKGEAIFDLGIGSTFSINKNTKSPAATAEFLNYYFSTDAQAALLSTCGKAPAPVALKAETLKEIDPRTMESKRHPGLFICGEALDAFGPIGGYNFLWAWATGRAAGLGAARED